MTPHILLLTSAQEVGGPLLVPISNVAYMAPMSTTTRIFLRDRAEYIDVVETFDQIVNILGGLVMKPLRGPVKMPAFE